MSELMGYTSAKSNAPRRDGPPWNRGRNHGSRGLVVDVGFRTPLLDFFRKGEVARDVRLLAAQGGLALRAHEQLALLVLLTEDADPEIARVADATLLDIPPASLALFLGRPDVPGELRTFFSARGIEAVSGGNVDAGAPLMSPAASDEPECAGADQESTLQKIAALSVAQRVALAMRGTREERAILIRDPNKLVGVNRNLVDTIGPSKISMMPDGLLDTLNRDEILDLVAYLYSRGDRNHKMFRRE